MATTTVLGPPGLVNAKLPGPAAAEVGRLPVVLDDEIDLAAVPVEATDCRRGFEHGWANLVGSLLSQWSIECLGQG